MFLGVSLKHATQTLQIMSYTSVGIVVAIALSRTPEVSRVVLRLSHSHFQTPHHDAAGFPPWWNPCSLPAVTAPHRTIAFCSTSKPCISSYARWHAAVPCLRTIPYVCVVREACLLRRHNLTTHPCDLEAQPPSTPCPWNDSCANFSTTRQVEKAANPGQTGRGY